MAHGDSFPRPKSSQASFNSQVLRAFAANDRTPVAGTPNAVIAMLQAKTFRAWRLVAYHVPRRLTTAVLESRMAGAYLEM